MREDFWREIITYHRQLDLQPADLERMILTGSFGGQIDLDQDPNFNLYYVSSMTLTPNGMD